MSKQDLYFTANLSILRSGTSELEALENILRVGIVNAGLGYLKAHGRDAFDRLIHEAQQQAIAQGLRPIPPATIPLNWREGLFMPKAEVWNYGLAGWHILGIQGGSFKDYAQAWIDHHRDGEVFFRIRSDWLWQAVNQARSEAGRDVPESKPLSWREFRILAGILSAKVNDYRFTFLGWELIQALACGFHKKELFQRHADKLPAPCPPLGRFQIEATLAKLEAMDFFARVRNSKGSRGGLTAYSFRLNRPALHEAIRRWKARNDSSHAKVAENRAADLAEFTGDK
jgi:hypothetical protein